MRPLDGRTWAIEEVPNELLGAVPLSFTDGLKPDPPAVVTQHMRSNRKFVIINSQVKELILLLESSRMKQKVNFAFLILLLSTL